MKFVLRSIYSGDETGSSSIEVDCADGLKVWIPRVGDDLKPVVGQLFESLDKGIEIYKKCASRLGFDVRLSCVKTNALLDIVLSAIIFLMIITQFDTVDCRKLQPTTATTIATAAMKTAKEVKQVHEEKSVRNTEIRVSSGKKTKDGSFPSREMASAFTLASGPSRRGPGH
ncbi:hypothetical protein OSB04_002846 [Centaurea solstitialis]|uniref:Uncharacterized protein n=1 Tax=Centaurea solstitialis TaxID=347529 RepID=A0AA38TTR3_9ASTR|nr:hypothetical protein OSB04_002846 [Centaurea solstitialis]